MFRLLLFFLALWVPVHAFGEDIKAYSYSCTANWGFAQNCPNKGAPDRMKGKLGPVQRLGKLECFNGIVDSPDAIGGWFYGMTGTSGDLCNLKVYVIPCSSTENGNLIASSDKKTFYRCDSLGNAQEWRKTDSFTDCNKNETFADCKAVGNLHLPHYTTYNKGDSGYAKAVYVWESSNKPCKCTKNNIPEVKPAAPIKSQEQTNCEALEAQRKAQWKDGACVQVGDSCTREGAKKAVYIWNNGLSCGATECDADKGWYMVKKNGRAQGWCKKCANGTHVNSTGDGCDSDVVTTSVVQTPTVEQATDAPVVAPTVVPDAATACSAEQIAAIENAVAGVIEGDKCMLTQCKDGFGPSVDKLKCEVNGGDNADAAQVPVPDQTAEQPTTVTSITPEEEQARQKEEQEKIEAEKREQERRKSEQKASDLKANAQKMKDKEQSTANKLLGAAAIGATGIGGMNLMSGMAEQKADDSAEEDMKAYLATFVCDYGQGRNIKGGEMNIDLPGGNDLTALVAEYRALAADLKIRKEALGKNPGIEAEVIYDIAETGLYDNVGMGRQSGAYASLSKALTDENSEDAKALAKQKADTASKVKTGAITAGIGAVGGVVGNLAINGFSKADKKAERRNKKEERERKEQKSKSTEKTAASGTTQIASVSTASGNVANTPVRQSQTAQGKMFIPENYVVDSVHPAGDLIQGEFDEEDLDYICECSDEDSQWEAKSHALTCRKIWDSDCEKYSCVAQSCEQGYYIDEYGRCEELDEAEGELCPIYDCLDHVVFHTLEEDDTTLEEATQLFIQYVDTTSCKWHEYSEYDRYFCTPDKMNNGNWEFRMDEDRDVHFAEKGNCALSICYDYEGGKNGGFATRCEYTWVNYDIYEEFECRPVACKSGYRIGKGKEGYNICLKD